MSGQRPTVPVDLMNAETKYVYLAVQGLTDTGPQMAAMRAVEFLATAKTTALLTRTIAAADIPAAEWILVLVEEFGFPPDYYLTIGWTTFLVFQRLACGRVQMLKSHHAQQPALAELLVDLFHVLRENGKIDRAQAINSVAGRES